MWMQRYIHHRNLLLRGYSEVSVIIGIFNNTLLVWLFLRSLGVENKYIVILPFLVCLVIIILYMIGRVYMRQGMIAEDYSWQAHQNPAWKELMTVLRSQKNENTIPSSKSK